jgi:hypothetical protein
MFAKVTPYAVMVDFIPDIRKEGEYRWSTGNPSSIQIKAAPLLGDITVGRSVRSATSYRFSLQR